MTPLHHNSATTDRAASDHAAAWLSTVARLSRLARELNQAVVELAANQGLTGPQFWLLWAVRCCDASGVCQLTLATDTGLSAAHTSGAVEQLRQQGWLVSQRDPQDRRRQLWTLTDAGAATLSSVMSALDRRLAGAAGRELNDSAEHLATLAGQLRVATAPRSAPQSASAHRQEAA